jgi:hypothetical protein
LGELGSLIQAVGTLIFTPNGGCTGGTVGGSITIRRQGEVPATFPLSGTYSVASDGAVTVTLPGVIDLSGLISLDPGDGTIANAAHLAAAPSAPIVLRVTATRTPAVRGPLGLTCPPDSVRSGTTCIDKYEASVWQTTNAAVIAKIRAGTVTLADLTAAGASQLGAATTADCSGTEYPATFPFNGNWTAPLYAVSIPGVKPSACLTWFQAEQACALSEKRLSSNQEWQRAAAGTPDPGAADNGSTTCVTSSAGPANTGTRSACVSMWGARDMVGNVWELVADWGIHATGCITWSATFGGDLNCIGVVPASLRLPGPLVRGGSWPNGTVAGVFAVAADLTPADIFNNIGFRCAR